MENKVLIFPEAEDFINFMEALQEEYNKTKGEGDVN